MSFSKKVALGSLLALSATSVFAVETADLRVIGTIAPAACTPVFTGGATVDYGVIPPSTLNPAADTPLPSRDISYTITCNAPIQISTSWTDARAATVDAPNNIRFGLGAHNGVNIGRYNLANVVAGTTADGAPVDVLQKNFRESPDWVLATTAQISNDGIRQYSYGPVGTLVPGAYSTYAGTLRINTIINPTQNLDLATEVTLDGLSTMTVNYL